MQTVISALDAGRTAHAVSRLVAAGFPREAVHIQGAGDLFGVPEALDSADHARGASTPAIVEGRGLLSSIGRFVTSLFGLDSPATVAYTYTDALQRGGSVLLVDVADAVQCERAIGILRSVGATAVRTFERAADQPLRDAVIPPVAGLTSHG